MLLGGAKIVLRLCNDARKVSDLPCSRQHFSAKLCSGVRIENVCTFFLLLLFENVTTKTCINWRRGDGTGLKDFGKADRMAVFTLVLHAD